MTFVNTCRHASNGWDDVAFGILQLWDVQNTLQAQVCRIIAMVAPVWRGLLVALDTKGESTHHPKNLTTKGNALVSVHCSAGHLQAKKHLMCVWQRLDAPYSLQEPMCPLVVPA